MTLHQQVCRDLPVYLSSMVQLVSEKNHIIFILLDLWDFCQTHKQAFWHSVLLEISQKHVTKLSQFNTIISFFSVCVESVFV